MINILTRQDLHHEHHKIKDAKVELKHLNITKSYGAVMDIVAGNSDAVVFMSRNQSVRVLCGRGLCARPLKKKYASLAALIADMPQIHSLRG